MRTFWRAFALFCIWTTPFQVALVLWGTWIVLTTDYSVLSLSTNEFINNYFTFYIFIKDWLYLWMWNSFLDVIFAIPIILGQGFKAIFTTWLGFWILKKLN